MKKIFKYFGIFLAVALMGAFTGCVEEQEIETADLGLGIKVFYPTKVVTGQPVTITGSGFKDVTEVIFPGDIVVTGFEHVGASMIRVVTPFGLPAEGGRLKVRNADNEVAESKEDMTLGHTVISGYSKQAGESVTGGEQITVFGKDLEFITGVQLLDPDGNPYLIEDKAFYRKSTSNIIFNVPKRNIFTGNFVGKLFSVDGREFSMPELAYEPSTEGGHWATVKKTIWKNDGGPAVSWSGTYRFALEGTDGNSEAIAELPADVWEFLKTETFYVDIEATDPQVRVTTGWWAANMTADDIQPGNELLTDNGDGTWTVEVNLSSAPDLLALLDEQHLLFTGDRYTPLEIYYTVEEWVEGEEEGHWETVKDVFWANDGGPAVSWSGTYRFALEGTDGNSEAIAEFPQELWDRIKTETFYLTVEATDPQVRVTTGWWAANMTADDIQPGNELIADNGDGTWTVTVNLAGAPDLLALLDEQHLLFTGDRYTPVELYFEKQEWVGGGGHMEIVKTPVWVNDGGPAVSWSGTYRFALEGTDGNSEAIAEIPADIWEKLKTETFYIDVEATDPQVRVTTGWWAANMTADDIQPGNDLITDNGDGTWTVTVNLSSAPDLVALMDEQHLLFTGDRYTPIQIYFLEEKWVGGGGGNTPKEEVFWANDGGPAVSWSGTYRFALEGTDGNSEAIAEFPQELWDRIKTKTFYLDVEATDPQVRVTTGWWAANMTADDIQPGNELITDNGDGTWTVTVDLSGATDLLALLDEQHLLFTGDRYTPIKLYFK
ncbi:MAG: IPT/TIG domain-containing protein [Bacteroidales bacterium]|nr:IPT/TIG domain-containing protein [Bacteroidales bacterium]